MSSVGVNAGCQVDLQLIWFFRLEHFRFPEPSISTGAYNLIITRVTMKVLTKIAKLPYLSFSHIAVDYLHVSKIRMRQFYFFISTIDLSGRYQ